MEELPVYTGPLTPIESSNIAGFHHDPDASLLVIQFKSSPGVAYSYQADSDERRDILAGFAGAESKGSYFAKAIRGKIDGVKMAVKKEG